MELTNWTNLLSYSDKERIQKICYLLSDKLTLNDIEDCLTCSEKIIDSNSHHKHYKVATISFALYTISQIESISSEIIGEALIALNKIISHMNFKKSKYIQMGVI